MARPPARVGKPRAPVAPRHAVATDLAAAAYRDRFALLVWRDLEQAWREYGPAAIRRAVLLDPVAFVQLAVRQLPAQLEVTGREGGDIVLRWLNQDEPPK